MCVLWLVFGTHSSLAEDCGKPLVKLGEIMAGLQAGLTAGVMNNDTLPGGYDIVASGTPRRGFIIPETGGASVQCDNDYILISEWFAVPISVDPFFRTPKEARELVNSGFGGLILDHYFEVDGARVDQIQTGTKIGSTPTGNGGRKAAFFTTGHIFEPFSLTPGFHTVTAIALLDPGRDGIPPFVTFPFGTVDFEVLDSTAP